MKTTDDKDEFLKSELLKEKTIPARYYNVQEYLKFLEDDNTEHLKEKFYKSNRKFTKIESFTISFEQTFLKEEEIVTNILKLEELTPVIIKNEETPEYFGFYLFDIKKPEQVKIFKQCAERFLKEGYIVVITLIAEFEEKQNIKKVTTHTMTLKDIENIHINLTDNKK